MEIINIATRKRAEFIDITSRIREVIKKSGIKTGQCAVFSPHTTAGLTINENADPAVKKDIIKYLDLVVPRDSGYAHAEGNSDSHIKSSLTGHSLTFIIDKGDIVLGTWQGVYFCEFDGPRQRKVYVKVTG